MFFSLCVTLIHRARCQNVTNAAAHKPCDKINGNPQPWTDNNIWKQLGSTYSCNAGK